MDPTGEYVQHPDYPCDERRWKCLDAVLRRLKDILEWSENQPGLGRFGKDGVNERHEEYPCRAQLRSCMLNTLNSGIRIGCSNDATNPGGAFEPPDAQCIRAKNKAANKGDLPGDAKCPEDPTCMACDAAQLQRGRILIRTDEIQIGRRRGGRGLTDEEACNRDVKSPWSGNQTNLAHLVIHELLHFCIGGHTTGKGTDRLGRPDPRHGAGDFMTNCGARFVPLPY